MSQLGRAHGVLTLDTSGIRQGLNDAKRQMDGFVSSTSRQMQSFGNQMAGLGQSMTLGLTAPLAAAGGVALSAASTFDDAMTQIVARTGMTGDALDEVRAKAMEMGRDTKFSATESANAYLQLATAGLDAEQSLTALPAVLRGAEAGNLGIAETGDIATNVMSSFRLQADDLGMVIDRLVQSAAVSPASFGQMGEAMASVGGIADMMGISVDETTSMLSIFAQNNIRGAEAGTQLRSLLRNMTRDTADVKGAWNELGVTMYDAEGNFRDINDIFADVKVAMDDLPMQDQNRLAQTIAGSYGILGWNAIMGSEGIDAMGESLLEQADAAEVAAKQQESFKYQITSLRGSVEGLMINAMTPFMNEVLKPIVKQMIGVVNVINDWVESNPELMKQMAGIAAVVAAAGPAMWIIGKAIAFAGAGFAALVSPIGLAAAAIAGFIAAYKADFMGFQGLVNSVRTVIGSLFDRIVGSIQRVITNVQSFFSRFGGLVQSGISYFTAFKVAFFGAFGESSANQINWLVDIFETAFNLIRNTFTSFVNTANRLWAQFTQYMALGMSPINAIKTAIAATFGTQARGVFTTFVEAVQHTIQWVKNLWTMAQPHLASLANWFLVTAIPGIVGFIRDTVMPIIMSLIRFLMRLWIDVSPFLTFLADWFLNTIFPTVVSYINTVAIPALDRIISTLKDIWLQVEPYLSDLYDWFMKSALPAIQNFIEGPITTMFNAFILLMTGMWGVVEAPLNMFKDGVTGIFDAIQGAVDTLANAITAVWDNFTNLRDSWNAWKGTGDNINTITENVLSGEYDLGVLGEVAWNEVVNALRDQGGPGIAGNPYLIGQGAQPELFIPKSDGYFIPNADRLGGTNVQSVTVYANDYAGGKAAARGFKDELDRLMNADGGY